MDASTLARAMGNVANWIGQFPAVFNRHIGGDRRRII